MTVIVLVGRSLFAKDDPMNPAPPVIKILLF